MSESWVNLKINIDPLAKLKPPLKTALTILEAIESILEALLALLKAFMLDLLNPLRAIIALLLAAIRAIINQIRSTGFATLFIRPDFRHSDLRVVFNSVSGGYRAFENKLVGKIYDVTDPFRPQYTTGMNAMMVVYYIGVESPGNLMAEILALLNLINHPINDIAIAAPVNLKVSPPTQSGEPTTQFWKLFQPSEANRSLVLEWKMASATAGIASPTLIGRISSSLPGFNLGQKFIIERTDDDAPTGEYIYVNADSKTQGQRIANTIRRYNVPSVSTKVIVKEKNAGRHKFFKVRKKADDATYLGGLTGTYRYTDTNLQEGKAYRYRVRAYMGDINEKYVDPKISSVEAAASELIRQDPEEGWIIDFGKKVVMGRPSAIVRGFVPIQIEDALLDLYNDTFNAIMAALLLNFELPYPVKGDSSENIEKKTGWGSLSTIAGPIGYMKREKPRASSFVNHILVKPAIRRLLNPALEKLRQQPQLVNRVSKIWAAGVKATVQKILDGAANTSSDWSLFWVQGDITDARIQQINEYLNKEDPAYLSKPGTYDGPLPRSYVSVLERSELANFIGLVLAANSRCVNYLQWYSVTIGDLFPVLVPFIYDFEQWILALLKALNSAIQEIADIIENLLQRIRDMEQLLRNIIALIEMMNIDITVSALSVTGSNGVDDLVQGLLNSQNKPGDKPYGFHSGYVFAAGGPGPGFIKALEALKFLVSAGS